MELSEVLAAAQARRVELPPPPVRRARRIAAGLIQDDLAAVLRVRRATIARWELGLREPRGELRRRYSEALDQLDEFRRTGELATSDKSRQVL
jgi:transcriptional regulator with XRE-family HTH domain